jgi:aminoglycoside phosphotransferase family enzyme
MSAGVSSPLEEKVEFLRDPRSHGRRVLRVQAIETHFAWVFLAGRYAYKLKKPIRHTSMDNRTLAARERACREELRLNLRLAPSVYLDVVPLSRQGKTFALQGAGRIEDWLVKMRRLPTAQMLDRVLLRRTLRRTECAALERLLSRFFDEAQPAPMFAHRYLERLRRQVAENRRALRGGCIPLARVEKLIRLQRAFIRKAHSELGARGACVVEGHGDLRAEHVCLGPPLSVIDSLEFSRELRLLDPAEEVALLSLEIARLGHPQLADRLATTVRVASQPCASEAIVRFYRSHRAASRAKLAVWHLGDPQFPDPRPWIRRARSYLADAERYARQAIDVLAKGASAGVHGRPLLEQRRKRASGAQSSHRLRKQRRDRQPMELGMP